MSHHRRHRRHLRLQQTPLPHSAIRMAIALPETIAVVFAKSIPGSLSSSVIHASTKADERARCGTTPLMDVVMHAMRCNGAHRLVHEALTVSKIGPDNGSATNMHLRTPRCRRRRHHRLPYLHRRQRRRHRQQHRRDPGPPRACIQAGADRLASTELPSMTRTPIIARWSYARSLIAAIRFSARQRHGRRATSCVAEISVALSLSRYIASTVRPLQGESARLLTMAPQLEVAWAIGWPN